MWLAAGGACVLGLPYLFNVTAYAAVTSIAVIGLYIAYVVPTLLRLRKGESFRARALAPGALVAARSGVIAVGWVVRHHGAVHAAAGVPGDLGDLQLRARSPCSSCSASPATWWLVSARHWFLNPDHERTDRPRGGPRGRARTGGSVTLRRAATPSGLRGPPTVRRGRSPIPDRRPGHVAAMLGDATSPGPLAQLAEQWTFNPLVVGSSPTGPTA